jgi:SAM-dependent methyltransferase
VDPQASAEPIHNDLRRYRSQWETNARLDALWAVLTLDGKLGGQWDERDFFETGRQEIAEVFRFMERNAIAVAQRPAALDFGCGVGRITNALAARVDRIVGIDISREMIQRARRYFPALTFHLNESDALGDFATGSVDLIYSNIVLQHLNGMLQAHYLREFGRLLRPGGLAIVQIPSRRPTVRRRMRMLKMLASLRLQTIVRILGRIVRERINPWPAQMELNILPRSEVARIAATAGLAIEAIGNIDWRMFYSSSRFLLQPEANGMDEQPEFPLSHLYFLRKNAE